MTKYKAALLDIKAYQNQWRKPIIITEPEKLVTNRIISLMVNDKDMENEPAILPDGRKLTYCRTKKQWYLFDKNTPDTSTESQSRE